MFRHRIGIFAYFRQFSTKIVGKTFVTGVNRFCLLNLMLNAYFGRMPTNFLVQNQTLGIAFFDISNLLQIFYFFPILCQEGSRCSENINVKLSMNIKKLSSSIYPIGT